jgi:hypothetical protein
MVIIISSSLISGTYTRTHAHSYGSEPEPPVPQMGDVSHGLMAEHAALSYGLTSQQADLVSQGAWDEDHCALDLYPPSGPLCFPAIPSGHHSWDPDTNSFWDQPEWWGDFGSGLRRTDYLFNRALAAYQNGQQEAAYLWLGRAMHLLGDMATPAHVLLDTHLPGDGDMYESWLSTANQEKTLAWLSINPAGSEWYLDFHDLPSWELLGEDLHAALEDSNQIYGGRESGQDLWQLGPIGEDPVLFRLMYLLAEEADNWDSNDVAGEMYHGQLDDSSYLQSIRDTLFPILTRQSTALIAYFHQTVLPPTPPNLASPGDGEWLEENPPQFSWHPVGVNPDYHIQVAADSQFDQLIVEASTSSSFFAPDNFLNGGTYYWRVRASTDVGESEWSPVWSFNVKWRMSLPVICRSC